MMRAVLAVGCAFWLFFPFTPTRLIAQGAPPATTPSTQATPSETPQQAPQGEAAKPEESKPEQPAPSTETKPSETPPPAAEGEAGPINLAELTRDGFEIRATSFIPAEAVTRQSGKVASDAFVVTLQKANAMAVCFYTLKAYVGKKLPTIPACTVHRQE